MGKFLTQFFCISGSTFTLNAKWSNALTKWVDIFSGTALTTQPATIAGCTNGFFYTISTYTKANGIGGTTPTCVAKIGTLLCLSQPVANPVIGNN